MASQVCFRSVDDLRRKVLPYRSIPYTVTLYVLLKGVKVIYLSSELQHEKYFSIRNIEGLLDVNHSLERRQPRAICHGCVLRRCKTRHWLKHHKVFGMNRWSVFGEV